ncbi:hypothetical protein CONCODRAFT_2644 [Conidiobolus coronatus NRRL 28638]|uniref:Uncharacterized protein n=1 Tax=Conidiobolus coronatus (strain ATCC 28846 / CBS 209.66 / NRRL 28638) TaxID=796925 RepID=A0A137PGZ1_CONC2|nr:hypothetical protein CONCODRAFT_2644 [Conidiobolus coronatus NRRL 28638]|eukprot:KXN74269.1 hypothetical protein CONCODRAFT_2644 [Conidiobolus coronatus NRRL 28638]
MNSYPIDDINFLHAGLAIFIGYLGYAHYTRYHYSRNVGPLKYIPGPSNELLLSIKLMHARLTGNSANYYKELVAKYVPICHSGILKLTILIRTNFIFDIKDLKL